MGISLRENSFRRTELPPTRSDIDVYSLCLVITQNALETVRAQ